MMRRQACVGLASRRGSRHRSEEDVVSTFAERGLGEPRPEPNAAKYSGSGSRRVSLEMTSLDP
jgi:hypothetical protein